MKTLEQLLSKYRVSHVSNDCVIQGMRVNRLYGLKALIDENLNKEMTVCEVGSYEGVSGELFAKHVKKLYCVDVFIEEAYEHTFDIMMSEYDNIVKVKANSKKASETFEDNFFDFVYIDAGHSYLEVFEDLTLWKPKVKNGGLIGGHDFHNLEGYGVTNAIFEYFNIDANKLDDIKVYEDSSWIMRV